MIKYQPHTKPSNNINQRQPRSVNSQEIGSTIKKKNNHFGRVREIVMNRSEKIAVVAQRLPAVEENGALK